MDQKYAKQMVEVLPNRLYWLSHEKPPEGLKNAFYFCVDRDLQYFPFFSDFGPLNLGQSMRFMIELEKILHHDSFKEVVIYHYTSNLQDKRANAAFLMGFYMVSSSALATELQRGPGDGEISKRPAPLPPLPRRRAGPLQFPTHPRALFSRHRSGY